MHGRQVTEAHHATAWRAERKVQLRLMIVRVEERDVQHPSGRPAQTREQGAVERQFMDRGIRLELSDRRREFFSIDAHDLPTRFHAGLLCR